MLKLFLVLILSGCTISGFDKSRKIEYSCEHNGSLRLHWEDDDKSIEVQK